MVKLKYTNINEKEFDKIMLHIETSEPEFKTDIFFYQYKLKFGYVFLVEFSFNKDNIDSLKFQPYLLKKPKRKELKRYLKLKSISEEEYDEEELYFLMQFKEISLLNKKDKIEYYLQHELSPLEKDIIYFLLRDWFVENYYTDDNDYYKHHSTESRMKNHLNMIQSYLGLEYLEGEFVIREYNYANRMKKFLTKVTREGG